LQCITLVFVYKTEVRLFHNEIGLLKLENRNQSLEIALLKGMMASQDKKVDQKIVKEVGNQLKGKDSQIVSRDHQNHSPGSLRQKRPYRLVPIKAIHDDNEKIDNGKIFTNHPKDQQHRFYGPPTNCSDLARLGHTLNGFYTVLTTSELVALSNINDTTKFETVYCSFKHPGCTFNSSAVEKRIPLHLKLLDRSNQYTRSAGNLVSYLCLCTL